MLLMHCNKVELSAYPHDKCFPTGRIILSYSKADSIPLAGVFLLLTHSVAFYLMIILFLYHILPITDSFISIVTADQSSNYPFQFPFPNISTSISLSLYKCCK